MNISQIYKTFSDFNIFQNNHSYSISISLFSRFLQELKRGEHKSFSSQRRDGIGLICVKTAPLSLSV